MTDAPPFDSPFARQFMCPAEHDTHTLAQALAPCLRAGDVVALWGGLGAGKTSFARGLICALAETSVEVPSPTYTLVQTYCLPRIEVWHFDLYRLASPQEVEEIGFEESQAGLALIEWPERAGLHLPNVRLDIRIVPSGTGRQISLDHGPEWKGRFDACF
jgi:tRNA threonylcarbamoyladenosine biosynthesis protein TsaE